MRRQQGLSLISLLVGLLISSFVLSGMMMIFRNTIQVVVPSTESSRSDGERVSSLLAAHMLLQDAGFGIKEPIYGTHIRVLNNSELVPLGAPQGSTAIGDTVLWLSNIADNEQCSGLWADKEGGLWRVSCDKNMGNITSTSRLILPSQYSADNVDAIKFIATRASCQPFGIDVSGEIRLTVRVQNSVLRQIESSTCLLNFASL
ncbi:PilW family protein [Pseudoalteromonas sp. bablab_jr011]|uniref:PilW family protein n=1 Tax=Pseudoalteromonas sp. bablab_jr011 TaxID=2755062 RepID=UPI0018F3351D|nr:prepilin-type N-terminal cleavage/methylation domain-containing protein [Pseudoalteromonas sp. bablab_jr011]